MFFFFLMLLFTFQQLFSCVQNLDRKFPASSSIDLNSAGQNNMRGSTGVYNDVFVSKDPQAKKKDCSTSLQPTVVPFSSGFVCCFLSSYGRLISCRSFFFFSFFFFFFFFITLKVFFNFYHRGSFMCHSTDITGHSITIWAMGNCRAPGFLGSKSAQIVEVYHRRAAPRQRSWPISRSHTADML